MSVVIAVVSIAFVVAVALLVLLSIPAVRGWVGLGNVTPTGVPGWVAEKLGNKAA